MNFISTAISLFIFFMVIRLILNHIPMRNRRAWEIGIITFISAASIIYYIYMFFESAFSLVFLLSVLGNILAIIVSYVASLMIILEDIKIFKTRRMRQFERDLNNKGGKSIPRGIIALICLVIAVVLGGYGTMALINYSEEVLTSIIGTLVGATIALILAIYFFITALPQHKTLKAENLIFIINLPNEQLLFQSAISKDLNSDMVLEELRPIYLIDEYGLLITPTQKYIVKGIKVNSINAETLGKINMTKIKSDQFGDVTKEFQKYNRKKIVIDENNNIVKISKIK